MDSITPEIISNKCSKTVRKGLESSLGCPTLSEKNGLSVKEEATVGNTVVAQTPFEESDGLITFPISGPLGVKRQSSHREPRLPSRREMSAWKREEFITQDLAIARNGQVAAKHGGHAYIRLKGWTRVGEFHWNFPIYGSFFDFCELIRALENWDPVERRALLKDNLISARLFNRFRRLFCPPAAGSWKQLAFGAVVAAFEPPEVLEAVDDVVQTHLYIPVAEFGEDDWEEQVFWGMEADLIKLFHYLDVSIHEFVTRWRLYRRLHRFVRTRVALPPYDPRIRINQFYVTQELQEFFDKRYARQVMWKDSMSRAFDDIIERAPVSLINWIKVKFITQPAIRAQGALAAGFNWPVCIAVVLGNVSVWSCDNDVTFFYKCLFVVLLFTASQTVVCRYLQSLHFSYMLYYICLVAPLLEECVKLYVPGLMFACNEVVVKVTSIPLALEKPWAMVPAFLMHCLAGKVSFTTGLFVHVVLNVSVSIIAMSFTPGHDMWFLRHDLARRWFRLSSGTVDFSEACAKFEDLAWVIDLIRKMMAGEKEKVGIMLSLAMRASYLARLKELFEVDSTDDIVDKFSWLQEELTFEQEPGPEEIVLLGTPVKEFFETIVPEYVSHSPAVRKLVALGALIFSSSFVQESSFIKFFQYFVEWDTIKEYSDPLAIVFHGVNAIVKFLMKFPEAKCWEDVFELPGLEKFLREGNELLETEGTPGSQNELLERIAIARILIKKQELKPKMPETSRLVEKLRKFVKDLKTQLDSTRPRKQPMLIDLRGDSGAGKTIIASTIIRMLRAYNKWVEQEGDVLYYNINDKYPASGCRNKYAKFVVINDMPEIYDDFPQRDLMSLDIVWQIILDTYPLTFRFAAVDDKGMFFNDVQYLLCSSNFKAYKCPGRTEKLNRRMDSGVLSMVRLVDAKGNSIPFSSTLKMDQGERNAALKFTICEPACTDKVIALKETEVKYNLQQFLRYVIRRAGEHAARSDDDHKKFEDPASLCACGSSYHLHYHQPAGEKSRFFPILPECVEWILKHPQLAYPSSEPIGGKYEPIFADPVIPSSFWEENSALLLGSPLEYLWHVWFAGVVIFLYHFIQNIFADIWEALAEKYVTSFELWAVSHPLVYKAFQLKARLRDDEVYLRTCMYLRRNMLKLKLYAIKYRNFLMLASLAAIAGLVTVRKRKVRSEALGGAIFKEQVDPDSMFVEVSRREMAYTPQAAKAWNKPGAEIYHVELTKKGTSQFDLLAKLRAQVVRARQVAPEGPRNIWVLILNSNHVVMNGHYLYPKFDGNSKPFEKFSLEIFGKFQAYELSEVVRVPGKEYVLLHNSFMPHAYPLSDNMPVDSVSCLIDGTLVNGEKSIDVVAGPGAYYDASLDTTFTQVLQWDCVNTVEEEAGNCGSTLMIRVKEGWAIGAFMSFGVRKHEKGPLKLAGGCTFDKRTYDYAVSSEPTVHYHLCGIPLVENLSIRSDFREVGSPHLLTVGTVSGGTNTFRSTIKQSRVFANFAPYARESFSVPLKVRGLVGGEWKSAMKHTFKNVNLPDASSLDLKERAMLGYLEDVRSIAEKIKLRPLLLMEAIFGCPELGIERVDFQTAMGRKWRELGYRNKHDIFDNTGPDSYVMKEEFRSAVEELREQLRCGVCPQVDVDFAVKDEVRPTAKLDEMKVRLFSVLSFSYNALGRMYIMPLIKVLLDNPMFSECFGQMNAGSKQWSELAAYLISKGGKVGDLDFSAFDTSHGENFFKVGARFFKLFSLLCGYTEDESLIVYYWVMCLRIQLLRYMCDIVLKLKGMPSGVIITLILNSLINSWLMRMAFIVLTGRDVREFKEYVSPATVGDDNAYGISDEIIEEFNPVVIKPLYHSWGYVITPASKNGDFQKFLALEDIVFVKRKFVMGDFGYYLAPLDTDSIYKSLMFEDESPGIPAAQRLLQVGESAQREFFLHGVIAFKEFQDVVFRVYDEHRLAGLKRLSYEELRDEFLQGSFKTFMC